MTDLSQMELQGLTLSQEDFPVRTSVLQEIRQDLLKKQGQVCGQSAPVYLGTFDQSSPSLKTSQHCLTEQGEIGLSEFSGTFPRSGMMRNGTVFQLPNLARTITEIGSGLLPTPRAMEVVEHPKKQAARLGDRTGDKPNNLQSMAKFGLFPKKFLPTPVSSDATTGQIIGKNDTFKMTKKGNLRKYNGKGTNGSLGLARHVKFFPTPAASDNRDRGNMSNPCLQRRIEKGKQLMLSQVVHPTSGKLNPNWVEWLMGFPTGHTDLNN